MGNKNHIMAKLKDKLVSSVWVNFQEKSWQSLIQDGPTFWTVPDCLALVSFPLLLSKVLQIYSDSDIDFIART